MMNSKILFRFNTTTAVIYWNLFSKPKFMSVLESHFQPKFSQANRPLYFMFSTSHRQLMFFMLSKDGLYVLSMTLSSAEVYHSQIRELDSGYLHFLFGYYSFVFFHDTINWFFSLLPFFRNWISTFWFVLCFLSPFLFIIPLFFW